MSRNKKSPPHGELFETSIGRSSPPKAAAQLNFLEDFDEIQKEQFKFK
jgi:hypothetical protein